MRQSLEDYLEAILILSKNNQFVRSIDVATYLGFSKPSVSRAVKIMKNENLITIADDGSLILTATGLTIADKMYERHRFFTDTLIKLGVDKDVAQQDACRIEHAITQESFEKLKEALENVK